METLLLAYFYYHFGLPAHSHFPQSRQEAIGTTVDELTIEQQVRPISSFPAGAQRVPLLDVTLTASCHDDIHISAIAVQHKGLGSTQDITGVYALEGTKRLHTARQVQRNGSATLRLRDFVVDACASKQITIAADFSTNAAVGGQHWFEIINAKDIETSASVKIQAPKNAIEIKPYTSGGVPSGTISVSYPKLHRRVRYGTNQVLARIKLEADGVSDHLIHAITLTNQGSATDDDVQNVFLQARTNPLTIIAKELTGDAVRLEFRPPMLLKKNQQRLIELRGDVQASRSKTLQFLVEESSDIEATIVRGR